MNSKHQHIKERLEKVRLLYSKTVQHHLEKLGIQASWIQDGPQCKPWDVECHPMEFTDIATPKLRVSYTGFNFPPQGELFDQSIADAKYIAAALSIMPEILRMVSGNEEGGE